MDELQSALKSLGNSNPLKIFVVENGPKCYLTPIDTTNCFEFWQKSCSKLKSIGWYPVLINSENDLSLLKGFARSNSSQAKAASSNKESHQGRSAHRETALRLKRQQEEMDRITPADIRKRFAEHAQGKNVSGSATDFFNLTPAISKDMSKMSDADLEAMLKQSKDSMHETMQLLARLPSARNSLEQLHAFENPHGEPGSASECIQLGNSLDAVAWFKLYRKLDQRFDSVKSGNSVTPSDSSDKSKRYSAKSALALLVPDKEGFNVPSALGFGGWNSCPSPQMQTAILKRWHGLYGAELISLGRDSLTLFIPKPVTDKEIAVSIAKEQYVYDNDLVDQNTGFLNDLVAQILNSHVWNFWWD